ncbi:MAG: hypothetical protein DRJ65_03485 [Acidobacteria bacterium]|nr:MAG: hypothetical protein DRJ65_03485 [Acidobacteriota bacterium]
MVFFNYALRKLNAKIVYYGPGLCGKTTNLQWIHDNFEGGNKGKMVSLATEGDRTIFFDLLPLDIGKIRGMDVTLQLYTVPGQVHYNSTRQLVLRGADGVVFVADSQRAMQSSNGDSLKNLDENLGLQGINLAEFPHVIQFNKRDLGELMSLEEMDGTLNRFDAPFFESVAVEGIGVQDTLEGIVRLVMRSLKDRYEARGMGAQPTRVKAAGTSTGLPDPGDDSSQHPSGVRALSTAETPTIFSAPSGEDIGSAEGPDTVEFENQKEPEIVLPEAPPMTEWGQSAPDDHSAPEPVIEQLPDLPGESSNFESIFDIPAVDVGPLDGGEAKFIDDLELTPSEEIDTQTGLLVPPLADGIDSGGVDPVDLLPEGHGKPFDTGDQDVSVAQYDTADVDDLVASVLGTKEAKEPAFDDRLGHGADLLEASSQPEEIAAESAPEEIDTVDQTAERDAFDVAPEPELEVTEGRPSTDNTDAGWLGETDPGVEVDLEPEGSVPDAGLERDMIQPPSRPPAPVAVVFDDGDPFTEAGWEQPAAEPPLSHGVLVLNEQDQPPVSVTAEHNSLALKLTGTGAIVESGQMRALDIEVPVPGNWVGNRKVTLQLRLTLLPVTEDENDGTNSPA